MEVSLTTQWRPTRNSQAGDDFALIINCRDLRITYNGYAFEVLSPCCGQEIVEGWQQLVVEGTVKNKERWLVCLSCEAMLLRTNDKSRCRHAFWPPEEETEGLTFASQKWLADIFETFHGENKPQSIIRAEELLLYFEEVGLENLHEILEAQARKKNQEEINSLLGKNFDQSEFDRLSDSLTKMGG